MNKKTLIIIISSIVAVVSAVAAVLVITNNNVKYTITFNSDGGTLIKEQIVKKGESVTKPSDPIKKGYKFISWTYQNKTYDFSLEVTSDMELKAKWYEAKEEIKEYIVKFNTDGGTTFENQIVEYGKKVIRPKNPTKEGHEFKGWYLNDKEYDFETVVTKDIQLEAKWEKVNISTNNNKSNNSNNSSNNNNNDSNNNDNELVKLITPTISEGGFGDGASGTRSILLALNPLKEITGIEIYSSTTENGTYTLKKTVKKEDWNNDTATVFAQKGEHLYFKVRTYVKNNAGTFYSEYSNIIELNNSLKNPTISEGGFGDGTSGTRSILLALNPLEEITGIEIYSSTTENGTYTLKKTVKKEDWNNDTATVFAQKGEHLYFKVRTYVKNNAGTFYSEYSNIIELNNSLKNPTISEGGFGDGTSGTRSILLALNPLEEITGIEIYSSTTENGTYTLKKTVKKEDWNNDTATVFAQKGEHLYFKVRTYVKNNAGTFYSEYSNIIELNNSLKNPTISEGGFGDGTSGTRSILLALNPLEEITGIEIYSSTTENGTYTLKKTVKKEDWNNDTATVFAQKGEHLYFKVRTYVKNNAGTFYSEYSNIIELNNSN